MSSAGTEPRIGSELLGYRIEELLGRGGMGVVYRAYDPRLKRSVALKLIAPELAGDERFRERFLAETEVAASLEHPNVVPIHDAGELDGRLYLAMRHVHGNDLKTLLAREGPLEPKRALALCAQVAGALDAAHACGLVHRDVKPSNVLLDQEEHVYLADFGLTRRIAEGGGLGHSLGTPAYAAPEQIRGDEVDGRADVYSLGCLLYECLAGEPPFRRDSELATLWAQLNDPPPKLPTHPALDPVFAKALSKDPQERYGSCRELVEAAAEALGIRDVVVVRDRRPLVLAVLGTLVLAGALAAGLALSFAGGTSSPKPDLTVRDNTLVRVDPKTNRIAAVTGVGEGPQSAAVGGRTVWVYNWDDRTVSAIDERTNAVTRTLSITGSPPFVPSNSIAADASGAWAISSAGGKTLLTHLRSGLRPQELPPLAGDPVAVALGGGSLWVATKQVGRNGVFRISPRTGRVTASVRLPAEVPTSGLLDANFPDVQSLAAGEGAVWVLEAGQEGTAVVRIDPASSRITGSNAFATHGQLSGSSMAVGHGAVWAVLPEQSRVKLVRVDARTLQVRAATTSRATGFGSGVQTLALDDEAVWWNNGDLGLLLRVDPVSGGIVSRIRITQELTSWADFGPYATTAGAGAVWLTVRVAP
jgi:YVTN family beta-propeller protein